MVVMCPHDSAGDMCIMWMNLVQMSSFSRSHSSKPLMLILERLMKVEMCTSAPGISRRADKTWDHGGRLTVHGKLVVNHGLEEGSGVHVCA